MVYSLNVSGYPWPVIFSALYLADQAGHIKKLNVSPETMQRYQTDNSAIVRTEELGFDAGAETARRALRLWRSLTDTVLDKAVSLLSECGHRIPFGPILFILRRSRDMLPEIEAIWRLYALDREGLADVINQARENADSYKEKIKIFLPDWNMAPKIASEMRTLAAKCEWDDIVEWIDWCMKQDEKNTLFTRSIMSLTGKI
ncbi:hypothetical protein [Acetobacter fallax]|uniref:Uncharacterized protein n=1 Tax=Acetobacter fallax TaxID=1737473 RepID=A0ABX0KGK3_9PROT|nr:hypothetical protein [Acetobacter fallax]NHO34304.1 hypothetical protein [Acetobacter fallax]NHO37858.1 hypothetical protein [Acetobacter fallax]